MDKFVEALGSLEVLSLTIYGEARGESISGQIAVGCVIRNRFWEASHKSYKDICLAPLQFSCWNDDDPNHILLESMAQRLITGSNIVDAHYIQCSWVAEGIIDNLILDNTNKAHNYMTKELFDRDKPNWAKATTEVTEIGKQVFFTA